MITAFGARTAYIEKASPWENGYVVSFNVSTVAQLCTGAGVGPCGRTVSGGSFDRLAGCSSLKRLGLR